MEKVDRSKKHKDLEKSYIHSREKPETDVPSKRKIEKLMDYGAKFGHLLLSDTMEIANCSVNLVQHVIDKHGIKNIDGFTCEYFVALAKALDKKGLVKWSNG
jgi:hypothetical protein